MFRTVSEGDEAGLIAFYDAIEQSFRWYMKEDPRNPDIIGKWIACQAAGKAFSIIALTKEGAGDRIVAHATLLYRPHGSRRHIGRVRVLVAPDFRSKQLGTWMIFDLIKRAMEMGIEKLRMDFVVGVDDQAAEGVRKLDFIQEALLKGYLKDQEGRPHDYLIMVKQLHKGWGDF